MVYMLSKFLSSKRILIDAKANSLEDAILLCGNLLVGDGCATCEYPAAMVKTARQLGDAIVMAPQTALPHASFSEGGLRPAVSVVRLAQPLDFGKASRPVRLLLGFCGSDAGSHMEVLSALAQFLSIPCAISSLLCAPTAEDLYRTLSNQTTAKQVPFS